MEEMSASASSAIFWWAATLFAIASEYFCLLASITESALAFTESNALRKACISPTALGSLTAADNSLSLAKISRFLSSPSSKDEEKVLILSISLRYLEA